MSDNHTCRHLLDSLSDYVDGELDETLCDEIEAHMAGCDNCRIVVDTLRMTVDLYNDLPAPDLPRDVRQRLYASLSLDDFMHADAAQTSAAHPGPAQPGPAANIPAESC